MSIMSMVEMLDKPPEVELTTETLKEVKEWDVGKTYAITLKVKMREKELKDDGSIEGCFTILKASGEYKD